MRKKIQKNFQRYKQQEHEQFITGGDAKTFWASKISEVRKKWERCGNGKEKAELFALLKMVQTEYDGC